MKQAGVGRVDSKPALVSSPGVTGMKTTGMRTETPATSKEPRPVCSATKHNGEPCTARVILGGDGKPKATCVDHQPAIDRLTADEQAALAGTLKRMTPADLATLLGWWHARKLAQDGLASQLTAKAA